jgi:hypothetical protein
MCRRASTAWWPPRSAPSSRKRMPPPAPPLGGMSPTSSARGSPSSPPSWGDAETDVLAFMNFPRAHWPKLHSTNPLERLNKEVKRRANVVGIFPNEASVRRLVGANLLEQNDEWQLQHRYDATCPIAGVCQNSHKLAEWIEHHPGADCHGGRPPVQSVSGSVLPLNTSPPNRERNPPERGVRPSGGRARRPSALGGARHP